MARAKEKKSQQREIEPYQYSGWLPSLERMEELFENFLPRPFSRPRWPGFPKWLEGTELTPSVDIFEKGNDIIVKSELPGMSKDDIEVNLHNDRITISGEKKKEEKVEKKNYYHLERSHGSFSRSFILPAEVQADKAKASFKNGILEIKIPKIEKAKKKSKKVTID